MPVILFGLFALLLAVTVPVAIAMAVPAIISINSAGIPLAIVVQRFVSGMSSFPLLAIPLFIWTGSLMNRGGVTRSLINFAYSLVGSIKGGLAAVNILTNMIFGGVSGSAVADAGAIGKIMIPNMIDRGYSKAYAACVTATAATIALLIPPSIDLILYGVTAHVSIGMLFQWGLLGGLFLGAVLIGTAYFTARKRGYPAEKRASLREVGTASVAAIPALIIPIVVIGGVRFGIFTPTEGGAIAVLAAILVGKFCYKELSLENFATSVKESVFLSSAILVILAFAKVYSWALLTTGITDSIQTWVSGLVTSRVLMLIVMIVILLLIGTVLEGSAAILIFTPLLLPIATATGISALHFGIVTVAAMTFGLVTPPVGLTLLISCSIAKIPLHETFKEIVPWFLSCVGVLCVFAFVPLFFY